MGNIGDIGTAELSVALAFTEWNDINPFGGNPEVFENTAGDLFVRFIPLPSNLAGITRNQMGTDGTCSIDLEVIEFNDDVVWFTSEAACLQQGPPPFDYQVLRNVAIHEGGHVFGLWDITVCPSYYAMFYGSTPCEDTKFVTADDSDTFCFLYASGPLAGEHGRDRCRTPITLSLTADVSQEGILIGNTKVISPLDRGPKKSLIVCLVSLVTLGHVARCEGR
jgi:hypothetical protein